MVCENSTFLQNPTVGCIFIIHGSVYIIPYILCIIVMGEPSFSSNSCYKIMFCMGFVDLGAILFGAISTGIMSVYGVQYCPNEKFSLSTFIGTSHILLWAIYCSLCVVLSVNRLCATIKKDHIYFNGNQTYYWVFGCVIYGTVYAIIYATPYATITYNSVNGLSFLTGPIGLLCAVINNGLTPIIIWIVYGVIYYKQKQLASTAQGTAEVRENMRRLSITVGYICFATTVTASSYILFPTFVPYQFMLFLAQLIWQMCQGANCIVYLVVNKRMRQAVLRLVGLENSQVTPVHEMRQ